MGVDQSDESPHEEEAKAGALVVKEMGRRKPLLANNQIYWACLCIREVGRTLVPFVLDVKRIVKRIVRRVMS
jgi:hypothetical protein